jgi:hypothetical protein
VALGLLLAFTRRADDSGRLSPDERARLLADVKASLERGTPRMNPAGGAP